MTKFSVGQCVRLVESGITKMVVFRGFTCADVENVVGVVTGVQADVPMRALIYFVEFDGLKRPDGKRRFGFVESDLEAVSDDERSN